MWKLVTYILLVILAFALITTIAGCTENQRARNFGGNETVNLPAGQKLVQASWKQDDLWYMTTPMEADYTPQKKLFQESSSFGVMEGSVTFIETR